LLTAQEFWESKVSITQEEGKTPEASGFMGATSRPAGMAIKVDKNEYIAPSFMAGVGLK
jgi:hypothetical protein